MGQISMAETFMHSRPKLARFLWHQQGTLLAGHARSFHSEDDVEEAVFNQRLQVDRLCTDCPSGLIAALLRIRTPKRHVSQDVFAKFAKAAAGLSKDELRTVLDQWLAFSR